MTEVQAERPPSCENCGCATVKLGKLSRLGSHPLINVYKCQPCRQIISITSALFASDLCIRPEEVRSREERTSFLFATSARRPMQKPPLDSDVADTAPSDL